MSGTTYHPIRTPRGRMVHATSLTDPKKTACGRPCRGWVVALRPLGCQRCKAEIHMKVRP